jgi:hypothetical protein
MLARIAKLEARCESGRTKTFHQLWARPDMDAQQQAAAMIAAGKAREGDDFMVLTFMEPSEKNRAAFCAGSIRRRLAAGNGSTSCAGVVVRKCCMTAPALMQV